MEPSNQGKVSYLCTKNVNYFLVPRWDASPREHEAPGGKYANGIITRNYTPGEVINVRSHITANHLVKHHWKSTSIKIYDFQGFVEVRLCRNNDVTQDPDQSCFDQPGAVLTFVST